MKKRAVDIVERILSEDVASIAKAIAEVEAKIKDRRDMTRELMSELNSDIAGLAAKDESLAIWGPGYKHSIDRNRDSLRSQLSILKNEARNVELNFWRDTTALEKELRILRLAYDKAVRKKSIMED
jgi:hypothetical protein